MVHQYLSGPLLCKAVVVGIKVEQEILSVLLQTSGEKAGYKPIS